jgi:hypothetical protein
MRNSESKCFVVSWSCRHTQPSNPRPTKGKYPLLITFSAFILSRMDNRIHKKDNITLSPGNMSKFSPVKSTTGLSNNPTFPSALPYTLAKVPVVTTMTP